MKKRRKGELDLLHFNQMPDRCKELFFWYLEESTLGHTKNDACGFYMMTNFYIPDECKSPIEQLFYYAYSIVDFENEGGDCHSLYILPQEEIHANGKTYYADFVFDSDYLKDDGDIPENPLKLVIECDGHEFHERTKEQVKRGNERDYNLKSVGYDILHFSGSQIHNEPITCAKKVYEYIKNKTGEWKHIDLGE